MSVIQSKWSWDCADCQLTRIVVLLMTMHLTEPGSDLSGLYFEQPSCHTSCRPGWSSTWKPVTWARRRGMVVVYWVQILWSTTEITRNIPVVMNISSAIALVCNLCIVHWHCCWGISFNLCKDWSNRFRSQSTALSSFGLYQGSLIFSSIYLSIDLFIHPSIDPSLIDRSIDLSNDLSIYPATVRIYRYDYS